MQIKSLWINKHQCLVDFSISFCTVNGGSTTILIGENGTGKTTMIDSILEIFMSFDSPTIEEKLEYDYEIEYEHAQRIYMIKKVGHRYQLMIDSALHEGSYNLIRRVMTKTRLFPQRIVTFYSGANNKVFERIKRINFQYNKKCREAILCFLKSMNGVTNDEVPYLPKRKYNYCDEAMTPIYLVAILEGEDSFEKSFLQEACHFVSVECIDVSINLNKIDEIIGATHFDHAHPTQLYYLTDYIDDRFTEHFRRGFIDVESGKGYFTLKNVGDSGADSISILEFFEKLHSLFDAEYEVTVMIGEEPVRVSNLSEGQRQLIKMIGMLGVCKSEDALVLMDEPDAHMNPRWKYEIKPIIDECLKSASNTQAIIATHDPLVINGVDKKFIRLFTFDSAYVQNADFCHTKVIEPTENTEGLGIDGLLQSEYYGLRTSYDRITTDKFIRRQELYSKLINGEADDAEKEELRNLTKEIGLLPVSYNSIDFLYDDFMRVYKNTGLFSKPYLSFEEIQRRRKIIKEIIAALYEGQV